MSIQDEAARVILAEQEEGNVGVSDIAGALADAGLLRDDTELNRLRRELEELSAGLERKAERAQRNGAYSSAVGYRETAKKIARILNGESNE